MFHFAVTVVVNLFHFAVTVVVNHALLDLTAGVPKKQFLYWKNNNVIRAWDRGSRYLEGAPHTVLPTLLFTIYLYRHYINDAETQARYVLPLCAIMQPALLHEQARSSLPVVCNSVASAIA